MMKIDSEASKAFAPQRTVSVTSGSISYDVSRYSNRWREPDNEKEITTTPMDKLFEPSA